MYKILSSDGCGYGPISAGKIKQWIQEDRVEKKNARYAQRRGRPGLSGFIAGICGGLCVSAEIGNCGSSQKSAGADCGLSCFSFAGCDSLDLHVYFEKRETALTHV
jgi:hypothetical protein